MLFSGGLLFFDGDSDPASLNPALNAAMLLNRYAPIATSNDKRVKYMVGLHSPPPNFAKFFIRTLPGSKSNMLWETTL